MSPLEHLARILAQDGLSITGAFHPTPDDPGAEGRGTVAMVGAVDGAMWSAFSAAPEATDRAAAPLDRWSARIVGAAAEAVGAEAVFPFGGPPYAPFMAWAARAEGAVPSPIGMSVTAARGLHASWRGAVAFADVLDLRLVSAPQTVPCGQCVAPCRTSCPVDAFAGGRYDIAACVAHVSGPEGADCRSGGCLARRSCPASMALPPAQRAFHLAAFTTAHLPR
ncbi:MAG: ferredoxin [Pseudomonadota bacterium]